METSRFSRVCVLRGKELILRSLKTSPQLGIIILSFHDRRLSTGPSRTL
jgi:hypothetical protein